MTATAYNLPQAQLRREDDILAERIADLVVQKLGAQPERKLLPVKDAALYIGVTAGAIRHLIASEEIPQRCVSRYGRRVFLKKAELDQWLETR